MMEEVEVEFYKCVDLWWDVVYFFRYEDEDFVLGLILDYGGEDYLECGYGFEDSDNLDGYGDDGEFVMMDVEVEFIFFVVLDFFEEFDFFVIVNGFYFNLDYVFLENFGGVLILV